MRSRRPAADLPPFEEADLEIVRGLEQNASAEHYLGWLAGLCEPHLGDEILEVGAGRSDLTSRLAKQQRVTATELSPRSIETLRERSRDHPT